MKPIELSFAGYKGPASIHAEAAHAFGDGLRQRLGDRVRFAFEPDIMARGHKAGDLLPMTESGELTGCYIASIRFSKIIPEFQLFELPFFFDSREDVYRALDGGLGAVLTEKMLARTPYRVLGIWDNGVRHITTDVWPIRTPADCRGLRIRIQLSEFLEDAFRALGFEPCAMDIKEFLDKVASNEVDAQENPLGVIRDFAFHDHHRYITLTGHIIGVVLLICNAKIFDAWPDDVKDAVVQAAEDATRVQRRLAAAEDEAVLAELDTGETEIIRLTAVERRAFAAATAPLIDACRQRIGPDVFDRHFTD
jgi:TRAP-type C4-dicarboxylate transport system substrate-binding protein